MAEGKSNKGRSAKRARSAASTGGGLPFARMHDQNGHGDCSRCRGRCCTYVTVEIGRPKTKVDVDEVRWLLAHEGIEVFIEEGDWYVQSAARCLHLNSDGRCDIYDHRFDVCRDHSVVECEMSDGEHSATVFTTTAEFDRWWSAHGPKRLQLAGQPDRPTRKR